MKSKDIDSWTNTLIEQIKLENLSLDFAHAGVVTKRKNLRNVLTVDKLRTREDGLFDRLLLEYEFFKPESEREIRLSGMKEFGWFIHVQYALHRNRECPVPCIADGGYCNLFDLTEYVEMNDDFVEASGDYLLGEEIDQIAVRLAELGIFLAKAIPVFVEKKIRPRLVQ